MFYYSMTSSDRRLIKNVVILTKCNTKGAQTQQTEKNSTKMMKKEYLISNKTKINHCLKGPCEGFL